MLYTHTHTHTHTYIYIYTECYMYRQSHLLDEAEGRLEGEEEVEEEGGEVGRKSMMARTSKRSIIEFWDTCVCIGIQDEKKSRYCCIRQHSIAFHFLSFPFPYRPPLPGH